MCEDIVCACVRACARANALTCFQQKRHVNIVTDSRRRVKKTIDHSSVAVGDRVAERRFVKAIERVDVDVDGTIIDLVAQKPHDLVCDGSDQRLAGCMSGVSGVGVSGTLYQRTIVSE